MQSTRSDLKALRHFLLLAQTGSLSRAAREHDLPKGTLSASLSRLEEQLGLALMERGQGGVQLTEAGEALARRIPAIFEAHDTAISAALRAHSRIEGTVRIVAAHEFGATILGAAAKQLAESMPSLRFDLAFHAADTLLGERIDFDCMIFFGEPPSTWLIPRQVGSVRYGVVAAPALARRFEGARDPVELDGLPGIEVRRSGLSEPWTLSQGARSEEVRFEQRFRVQDYWMAVSLAHGGTAAAYLPTFFVADWLRDGVLAPLVPGWRSPAHGVHLLYPRTRRANPRVRMVIEALDAALRPLIAE